MKSLHYSAMLFLVSILLFGCQTKEETYSHSPFHAKISAFTSGQISATAPVVVEFASPIDKAVPGQPVGEELLTITPSIKGETKWANDRMLIFKPARALPSGEEFKVKVDLPKLLPEEEEPFFFTFRTVPQNTWLSKESMSPSSITNYDTYIIKAKVILADIASDKQVEDNVTVTINGQSADPEWTHIDGRNHLITLDEIDRGKSSNNVVISVKKGALSPQREQTLELSVPAKNAFRILSAEMGKTPRKVIQVTFSDPIDPGQNISGLFRLSNNDINWHIDNNIVELYPDETISGEKELTILPDVKNINGKKLSTTGIFTFSFSSENPAVEILGNGTIMPYSDGLYLPFKAVSLKAVRIRIIKIYEHNIGHFLQVNQLGGESQLKRAGRIEHKQRIQIDNDPTLDLNTWNTFSLDLSKFIQPDPGSIYRVEMGFEQKDAIFPCPDNNNNDTKEEDAKQKEDPEEGFWDSTDNYYSTYPYSYTQNYNWRERDNPCSSSYYGRNRWVARNVLASNLGLLAKRGSNNQLLVTVTDLRNATPLNGVDVEIFNLQMVKIAEGETNNDGQAMIPIEGTPFLMIAKKDKQRGYLRLDEGQALAIDRFDISGETVKQGIKGFMFGERGVWRPGDSLFVSFMLIESQPGTLPPNHPATFELINPRGRLIHSQTQTHPENILYTFETQTDEEAPTGFYLARITIGNVVFEKPLRIETIRPNRLKIDLTVDDDILKSGVTSQFEINSTWLHGSPASNLKADVRMNLRKGKTTFDAYNGYHFDDPTRELSESEITVYEGILDKEGHTSFRKEIPLLDRAPGMLRGSFITRVFEESGAFSTSSKTIPLSPFDVYTGIQIPEGDDRGQLVTDKPHRIDLITVDTNGRPVKRQKLQYTVYKIDWRWWWEKTPENLARYISSGSQKIIDSGEITTGQDGKGDFDFRVNKPNWGRYLIRVVNPESGHSTAATIQIDWPGWARESQGGEGASQLVFKTDKKTYSVGDDISVTFPSSNQGRALVTIETGSGVLKSWWVSPRKKETTFSFEATPAMTPNVFISVTLIQPYQQSINNRPLRLYGIVPVMIEDPATRLAPEIETTEVWRPDEEATIKVSEANNESMEYVVAVVDEGLLDLTNHQTPDPWSQFNAREALGVKTWDIYDHVIGAFGGKIEQLFSIGGDSELSKNSSANQIRRFEPMVRFIGPFSLKKRDTNQHKIKIPSYTGSVRVMVMASNGRATGSNHSKVKVKKPVMVWSAMPRVMSPGEKLSIPVTVFVTENNIKNVTLSVSGSEHYAILGENKKTVSFDGPGEKNIWFDLKTLERTGPSHLTVTATANSEQATQVTNLNVRMPNPPVSISTSTILEGNTSETLNYNLPGISGTNTLSLEVSAIPPMDLSERMSFLLNYPHGCIEQITSGAFPQLYLDNVVDLNDEQRAKMHENIASVIQRLKTYLTPDGGFAYWPGQSQPSDWGSSYAGHFMLEAEKQGYMIRPSIKSEWLKFQKKRANSWLPQPETNSYSSEQMLQAYRLYTLALARQPSTGAMNRLRQQSGLIVQTRWLLASAYALSGMHEVATEMINSVPDVSSLKVQPGTYGSSLRDQAILIDALTLLEQRETAMPLVREVAEKLNTNKWYSTQTTAWALMSIVKFSEPDTDQTSLQYTYTLNNNAPVTVGTDKPISNIELDPENIFNGKIAISNDTDKELFATIIMRGTPGGID